MNRRRLIAARHRRILRSQGQPIALAPAELVEIGQRLLEGELAGDLAAEFGVTRKRIVRALWNAEINWRHEPGKPLQEVR